MTTWNPATGREQAKSDWYGNVERAEKNKTGSRRRRKISREYIGAWLHYRYVMYLYVWKYIIITSIHQVLVCALSKQFVNEEMVAAA